MEKRYQVFVSSTYTDLQEERQAVTKALMSMDCIPAGMEMFGAFDEDQWDFIKRVIDDCDYYLLIIAGRYGSMTEQGISYTQMEYEYAVEKGIPVIAMLHENPDGIPKGKSDIEAEVIAKLESFRKQAKTGRLVDFWTSPAELAGKVAISLLQTMKLKPAIGWVRANAVANEKILGDINKLRTEKEELESKLAEAEAKNKSPAASIENIAGLDETITVSGTFETGFIPENWDTTLTWKRAFSLIAPFLWDRPNDYRARQTLEQALFTEGGHVGASAKLHDQHYKSLAIQFKALGLVNIDWLKTTKGDFALFWTLTPKGEELMYEERVFRTNSDT